MKSLHAGLRWGMATFIMILLLSGLAYYLFSRSYLLVTVHGESMVPTFQDGDRVLFRKEAAPARDHYVVFKLPEAWKDAWLGNDEDSLIKRVRLLPGDHLSWDGETWSRNGEPFSYLKRGSCEQPPTEVTLGAGEYFVTGDTTVAKTLDSREAFCRGLPYLVSDAEVEDFASVDRVF